MLEYWFADVGDFFRCADFPIQEAVFFISEAITAIHWGRVSDIIGRRPILLLSALGSAIAIIIFGLAQSFRVLLVARFIQVCSYHRSRRSKVTYAGLF